MTIENIDNVLQQLVLSGGAKLNWKEGESRSCIDGNWWVADCADFHLFDGHLEQTKIARTQVLSIQIYPVPDDLFGGTLQVHFDPESRRIEAMDVWDPDFGTQLLSMLFWPGMESARKLTIATLNQWRKAIADGWFEGI